MSDGEEAMRRALTAVGEVFAEYSTEGRARLHFALVVWPAGDPSAPVFGSGGDKTLGLEAIHAETRQAITAMAETFDEHKYKGVDDAEKAPGR
jgi:hypothetical protein